MSEYQYYEFAAVDRRLDARQQAEVRALSTRARITATSFVNEYHWGDFRGDPSRLMECYYDAHLHLTNWGTRRIMLRLPRSVFDLEVAEQFCLGDQVSAWTTSKHVILDLATEDDVAEWDDSAQSALSTIAGVREEIAAGDHRALYLAWLAGCGTWERDEDAFDPEHDQELEPPVPPGLRELTAAQAALTEFLRLDRDLLAIAAIASPPLQPAADRRALTAWITKLDARQKNRLLSRIASGHASEVHAELRRRFRDQSTAAEPEAPRRTVAEILDAAAKRRAQR